MSLFGLFGCGAVGAAPSTTITYTGQLLTAAGVPVSNGTYDFQFSLFNASTGGAQVGSTLSVTSVPVEDGVFYVQLSFGTTAFTGTTLYIQTAYRVHPTSGSPGYTVQSPRHLVPTSSYADYAAVSGSTQALQGLSVDKAAPSTGQVLTWTGSTWMAQTLAAGTSYTAGAGLELTGHAFSIAPGGVTSSMLAGGSVVSSALAPGSVRSADLAAGAVTSSALAEGSVTSAALADNAVTSANIAPGAVEAKALAPNSVTGAAIAEGAVGSSAIEKGAIGAAALAKDAVTSESIADGAVGADALAPGAVTGAAIEVPLALSGSTASNVITATNAGTGYALYGDNSSSHDFGYLGGIDQGGKPVGAAGSDNGGGVGVLGSSLEKGSGVVGVNSTSTDFGALGCVDVDGKPVGVDGVDYGTGTGVLGVCASTGNAVKGENTKSGDYGTLGGVNDDGNPVGVNGVDMGTGFGVLGVSSATGAGVLGENSKDFDFGYLGGYDKDGNPFGVDGVDSGSGFGVIGSTSGNGAGVFGTNTKNYDFGYLGGVSHAGYPVGVYGVDKGTGIGALGASADKGNGVVGENSTSGDFGALGCVNTDGKPVGVNGVDYGEGGIAVLGYSYYGDGADFFSGGDGVGVYGTSSGGPAALFDGDVSVTGALHASTKDFQIDHPLDPANEYLNHASVESDEMVDVYSGNVVIGKNGGATVTMPTWFQALNKDFRYQLTCIGGFAPVYVAQEIKGNQFQIAGGKPGMKVSWEVTGVRQDAYANGHPLQVEQVKAANERGLYLDPTDWGQPETKGINYAREHLMQTEAQKHATAGSHPMP
jgi:hypothetical protein